jgi:splicing factor 45
VKTTLADWAATEEDDVNGFYVGEKRQRGGRKKRKKNRETQAFVQNWDDIYDPSRPNIYEEYKHSDEQIAEVREWKDRLYAHRMARSPSRNSYSDDDSRPMSSMLSFAWGSNATNAHELLQDNLRLRRVSRLRLISTISLPHRLMKPQETMHLLDARA